jgi:hypothetical protein
MAILNPNNAEATVAIERHATDGALIGSKIERIGAGRREARLMTEYFPELEGKNQSSGYFRITSDLPAASFALYETQTLSVLSGIPLQH